MRFCKWCDILSLYQRHLILFKRLKGMDRMKKNYTKPEIELVEYVAEDVLMTSGTVSNLDNEVAWLTSWSTAIGGVSSLDNKLNF